MATEVYFKLKNLQPSEAAIETVFRSFMATFITPERPFYYHTDEGRLNRLFDDLAACPPVRASSPPPLPPRRSGSTMCRARTTRVAVTCVL